MSALLQAELLKLRTTRTALGIVGAALGLNLLLVVLTLTLGADLSQGEVTGLVTGAATTIFVLLLATTGITGEYRHDTISATFLVTPSRGRVLVAKALAYAVAGAALALLVAVVCGAVTLPVAAARGFPGPSAGDLAESLARGVLVAALLGAFGVGLGALVRNQAGAVIVVLLLFFLVEPIVAGFAPKVGRFGPLDTALALRSTSDSTDVVPGVADQGAVQPLPDVAAGFVLLGWVVVLAGGAVLLTDRRDV